MVKLSEHPVLDDHGFVALDNYCADDLDVANAARVSFNKRTTVDENGEIKKEDAGLINYLLKGKHGTPFEHNFFRFRIKAPIFVFREWHRHRIGHSYNEWSARYSELKPEFYIPSNVRTQVGKPGAYTYKTLNEQDAEEFRKGLINNCTECFNLYQQALENNIAKEQARLFLPVNIYSEMYWSCNARSLMHFLNLRNSEFAQWEIRQYAIVVEEIFAQIMPITHAAFINNGRVAP